ncbi:DUF4282 domain-containing protein [Mycolicibacterium aubagnense]|uniref:DUF4282 domain-containing protein n=1 Tax=Mycolicibacterium aubagnense TaxID=319707 RepID=A0ABM7IM46_9MYCO|nr:DUF4282 domain-containing protein [Mycolicibacterium aubagnense]TLH64924.1 hypothetical protein C1S80_11500 [Mycolicibacterium aubagnense]WGI30888.1 DUF4282 domain-containing protein [Mycolicibacterium aubagnense]BBX87756.1 hypothetical protein MAUB_56290 [Mycolicibacterium aubagnense]
MVDISRTEELDAEVESGGRSWPALTAFTDLGFRKSTAQHVVPLLYGLVIAGAVVLYLAGAVVAFELSALLGVFWLFLAGPVTCVAIVLVARVVLESLSAFMAMGRQVDELNELVLEIAELMIGVSDKIDVIPTLPSFGRGGRSRRRAAIMDMRDRIVARRAAATDTAD